MRKTRITILIMALAAGVFAGCGGGGGGVPGTAAYPSNYTLVRLASGDVGATTATLTTGSALLEASLATTTTVSIHERFYTSGRPTGVIGNIYDIQPDGLAFLPGTRFCISYTGSGYSGYELRIVTGAALDVELPTTVDGGRVCATLAHSSPYSMKRASSLGAPDYTIFGDLNSKSEYDYKIQTSTETDYDKGALSVTRITVNCDYKCIESGQRTFKLAPDGDLYIADQGTYPMWLDMDQYRWTQYMSSGGTVIGGIAYLLAAEYMNYFAGGMSSYIAALDPNTNMIQRFFYEEDEVQPYLYVEVERNEAAAPGAIIVRLNRNNHPNATYNIDRTTAAMTKTWISVTAGPQTLSLSPGDTGYNDLNEELLYYIYVLVGIEDTPDYQPGNAWDEYPRYNPNQELFAVNVMNLLRGLGWNNLEAIEIYYRDRLEQMYDPQPRATGAPGG